MQMVKRGVFSLLLLGIALLLFAPKTELYYALEHWMEPRGVILSGERIHETPLRLELDDATLYYDGVALGTIGAIGVEPYLVTNRVVIRNFAPSEDLGPLTGIAVRQATVRYALWHPKTVRIHAVGTFGEVKGRFDPFRRTLLLRWVRVGNIEALRPYLNKDREGWYYERTF